jgi:hypothetical protein
MIELLIKYGARISERRYMVVKWAVEHGKIDVLRYLFKKMNQLGDEAVKDQATKEKYINDWIYWCQTSIILSDEQRKETIKTLEELKK